MSEQSFTGHVRGRAGILERISSELFDAMEHAAHAQAIAAEKGLLQRLDPRVKLVGLLALILAAVFSRALPVIYALFILAALLAAASRVSLHRAMARIWLSVLGFTGILSLPALFLVPGDTAAQVPGLGWAMSWQGTQSFAFIVGRALTAASFAVLLILTTPWPHVLKALRALRVPVVFIAILGMTYRYIFLFLKIAQTMFEARRSRMLARPSRRQARRMTVASAGVLLAKSVQMSDDVYEAMLARGYRGRNTTLDDFRMRARDWAALAAFALVGGLALWLGWTGLTGG